MTSPALPESPTLGCLHTRRTTSAHSDLQNNHEIPAFNKWHHHKTHFKHTPSPSLFSDSETDLESTSRSPTSTPLCSDSDLESDYTSFTRLYSDSKSEIGTMRHSLTAILSANPFTDSESEDGSEYTPRSPCSESADELEFTPLSPLSSSITSRPAEFSDYPQHLIGFGRLLNIKEVRSGVPQKVKVISPIKSMEALIENTSDDSANSLRASSPGDCLGASMTSTGDSLVTLSPAPSMALMVDTPVEEKQPQTILARRSTFQLSPYLAAPKKLKHLKKKIKSASKSKRKRSPRVPATPNPPALPASDQPSPPEPEALEYPGLDELGFHAPDQFGLPPYTARDQLEPRIPLPAQSDLSKQEPNQPTSSPLPALDQQDPPSLAPSEPASEPPSTPQIVPGQLMAEFKIFPHDGNPLDASGICQKSSWDDNDDVGVTVNLGLVLQKTKKKRTSMIGVGWLGQKKEKEKKGKREKEEKGKKLKGKRKETVKEEEEEEEKRDDKGKGKGREEAEEEDKKGKGKKTEDKEKENGKGKQMEEEMEEDSEEEEKGKHRGEEEEEDEE
ncbi:hypothetical protein FPQ18DRAFT_389718 [Pyronema domesticum]|nr:hypothetical protein FPQ18DRAFT_389718 [Pyronema domesticum]